MELCGYARERKDATGRLEYYCSRFQLRMDLDVMECCRTCSEYCKLEG